MLGSPQAQFMCVRKRLQLDKDTLQGDVFSSDGLCMCVTSVQMFKMQMNSGLRGFLGIHSTPTPYGTCLFPGV